MTDNPDILALRRFLETGAATAITSSPLLEELGAWLRLADETERSVTLSFDPPEKFRQGAGMVQGGVVAAMLDFAMAYASFLTLSDDQSAATTSLTANYMGAAGPGEIIVTGKVEKPGRRICHTSARMTQGGKLIATATSTLAVLQIKG